MSKKSYPRLILASSSRYRLAQLANIGLQLPGISPSIDETPRDSEAPEALACRLAQSKAEQIAADYPDAVVIGGDQVAAVTDATGKLHTLGKPGNLPNAIEQLTLCSGNTVTFYTALSLVHNAKHATLTECETVKVTFKKLTEAQIERYLLSEQPYDCAGSFKSEGKGVLLFERIESRDPNTLIGMPVMLLRDMLAKWQIDLASIVLR
ncbi:MAG: Maf family protein [Pseudomonadota bacterium]|jgi:MAF protein|uniref:7-methyl-GTP pyrophosphatase n=1 Tax=Marisediminitalea aggregata TaxID=634436 RepID=A0A1M5Q8Y8_9ALTE|nr:Maf family protein [Marisediminitalea aggregata]MEC8229507.1 Maf family protein [Pseudomonadota bacterium]SHH10472.1 MAF protein [Marisediminitalea aggregata]|tara:strand:- start:3131 stop:3754 length:624 start_codon:yes stop_codon:yes gene_type:complete